MPLLEHGMPVSITKVPNIRPQSTKPGPYDNGAKEMASNMPNSPSLLPSHEVLSAHPCNADPTSFQGHCTENANSTKLMSRSTTREFNITKPTSSYGSGIHYRDDQQLSDLGRPSMKLTMLPTSDDTILPPLPILSGSQSLNHVNHGHETRHQRSVSTSNMPHSPLESSLESTPVRLPSELTNRQRIFRSLSVTTNDSRLLLAESNDVPSMYSLTSNSMRVDDNSGMLHSGNNPLEQGLFIVSAAEKKENMLQAVCFVEDALGERNFYHRIDWYGLHWYYRLYYNEYTMAFIRLASIAYLLVPFIEKTHPNLALLFDQILLLIIAGYKCLKYMLCGQSMFFFNHWEICLVLVLIVSEVDILCGIAGSNALFRMRRYLKPMLLISHSSWLKATFKNVGRTALKALPLFGILIYFIFFMSLLGLMLFSGTPEGQESFANPLNSTMTLVVLLTTANHPDVMMPFYSAKRSNAAFFIVFLMIATFFLLNIITAHIYYHFRGFLKSSLSNRRIRHHAGIRAAFELLDMISPELKDAVDIGTMRKFLCMVPRLRAYQPFLLHALDSSGHNSVNFDEFFILTNVPRQLKVVMRSPTEPSPLGGLRVSDTILELVQSKLFRVMQYLMMYMGLIWSCLEIFYSLGFASLNADFWTASILFGVFYVTEIVLLVIGYGPRYYYRQNSWHIWNSIIALSVVFEYVVCCYFAKLGTSHNMFSWQITCLTVFAWQSLRASRQVSLLRTYMVVISNIMKSLLNNDTAILSYVLLFFYEFAILGEDLYDGTVYPGNPAVMHTEYARLNYWANNFDDFQSALVTLWELMVVNNWFVIMEAYVSANSQWARLYFIAWYAVSVVLIFNLLVAFILDAFIIKWDRTSCNSEETRKLACLRSSRDNIYDFQLGATESHYLRQREDYCYTLQSDDPFGSTDDDPTEPKIIRMLQKHKELWLKISEVVSELDGSSPHHWETREGQRFSTTTEI
eukprot:CFRG0441T1